MSSMLACPAGSLLSCGIIALMFGMILMRAVIHFHIHIAMRIMLVVIFMIHIFYSKISSIISHKVNSTHSFVKFFAACFCIPLLSHKKNLFAIKRSEER